MPQVEEKPAAPFYKDILLGLLLLAIPFLLFPNGYGLLALLVLPTIWLIRWALVGSLAPRTPLDWPILLILLMVLASIGITFDLSFSIGKIAGVLLGIVIFYAVVDLADTKSSGSVRRAMDRAGMFFQFQPGEVALEFALVSFAGLDRPAVRRALHGRLRQRGAG